MEESRITTPHSRIITQKVIKAAKEAGGSEHGPCVVSRQREQRLEMVS